MLQFEEQRLRLTAVKAELVDLGEALGIEDAKKEAIDTIFEMVELKKAGQLSHIIISAFRGRI